MKKRWFLFLMAGVLLVTMLAVPVMAEEGDDPSTEATTKPPEETTKPPEETTKPPDETTKPPEETTKPACNHNWVDVTLPSTCVEYGGKCQVCSICEEVVVKEVFPLAAHTYDSPCDTDCNVCGAVRDAQHKFSSAWDYNSTKHWHPCSLCGAKKDEGSHYPGPAATEDKDQICLTCGKVMMTKRSHTHEASAKWESDETGHWHACKSCDEKLDFQAHRFGDTCGSPCPDCGFVPEGGHTFSDMWCCNEEEHWRVCTVCGAESEREPHVFDPDAAEQVCSVCADAFFMEPDHVHEFSETWEQDAENHWHTCDCGETADLAPHVWDEGTPGEDGTVTYVCQGCRFEKTGEAETEETPAAAFPAGIIFTVLGVVIVGLAAALATVLVVSKKPRKKGHFSH